MNDEKKSNPHGVTFSVETGPPPERMGHYWKKRTMSPLSMAVTALTDGQYIRLDNVPKERRNSIQSSLRITARRAGFAVSVYTDESGAMIVTRIPNTTKTEPTP